MKSEEAVREQLQDVNKKIAEIEEKKRSAFKIPGYGVSSIDGPEAYLHGWLDCINRLMKQEASA